MLDIALDAGRRVARAPPGAGPDARRCAAARRRPTRTIARVEGELGWEFMQIYGLTETSPAARPQPRARRGRTPPATTSATGA